MTEMESNPRTNSTRLGNNCRLSQWLEAAASMRSPTVITCDFDGTLTPRYADDEAHFTNLEATARPSLQRVFQSFENIGGVCTSRALLEVKRILDLGFLDSQGRSMAGFSAAENGAVVFCSKLSETQEETLRSAGYRIEDSFKDITIVNLAKFSPEYLSRNIVESALRQVEIPDQEWSCSLVNNEDRERFRMLCAMSKHANPERTHDACVRFGSGYVKVQDTQAGREFIAKLQEQADSHNVLCLITPPLEGHPIWTADLGGGVTKFDAMRTLSELYAALAGVAEEALRFAYFGDGENDLPAFEYISRRPGYNKAYLIDIPEGTNDERATRVAPGTEYLQGFFDIKGVVEGVTKFCGR